MKNMERLRRLEYNTNQFSDSHPVALNYGTHRHAVPFSRNGSLYRAAGNLARFPQQPGSLHSRGAQPQLRPRYAALYQDRLYVVEHRRPIHPDISVVRTTADEGGVAVASLPDTPLVVEIVEEEISQSLLHIIEAGHGQPGCYGDRSPESRQQEGRPGARVLSEEAGGVDSSRRHFVEIDLLRDGERSLQIEPDEVQGQIANVSRWHYVVTVTRRPGTVSTTQPRCASGCRGSASRWPTATGT